MMRNESLSRLAFKSWLRGEAAPQQSFDPGTLAMDFAGENGARLVPEEILPKKLLADAYAISCYRDETRWSFLDAVCARFKAEGPRILDNPADNDAIEWGARLKAIRRDVHKAHAFVRFKKVLVDDKEVFVAWHNPQHFTVDIFIRLFTRRFPKMHFTISTRDETAHFAEGRVAFSEGQPSEAMRFEDTWEDYWRTYYKSIFNPARLMIGAMKKEMPMHHWQTLPEARLIPGLIRSSGARLQTMARRAQPSAAPYIDENSTSLEAVAAALGSCRGCDLHQHCRVTPGKGNPRAKVFLVGEQPGDEEEKRGEPFVGAAGQMLRRAADECGISIDDSYVTNAVKHFKFENRGPYRLHKNPARDEIAACRPWLQREIQIVIPKVIVCLGSTAALGVTGRLWPVERYRGTWLPSSNQSPVLLTYHPAAILRASEDKKMEYYRHLVQDLGTAHRESMSHVIP